MAGILRQGVRHWCRLGLLISLLLFCAAEDTQAQRITRWFDDAGGVHFTASPPPPGVKYELVNLSSSTRFSVAKGEVATPETQEIAADAEASDAAVQTAEKADGEPASPQKDARVVFKDKDAETIGPSTRELKGTVKNVGGQSANGVSIKIDVLEDGQGNDCLQDTVAVAPSNLAPGETGTYSTVLDSPCLFGDPNINLTPSWDQ